MSGSPSEAEVQSQWRAAVKLLESTRNYADGTVGGAGGLLDVLVQALEGEYTPSGLTNAAQRFRQGLSSLIDSNRAGEFLAPVLYEYGRLITLGGFRNLADLWTALYEHFHRNTLTVESRAISYDSTATAGGSNVGNGSMSRLTVDRNGYSLEACTVETKLFRCRQDQNTGAQKHAEVFEVIGQAQSPDALLLASFGSGIRSRAQIRSRHAGTGNGGSLLKNSSWDTYNSGATPKFTGWTETAGGSSITQDTTDYYRTNPSTTVDGALKITGGGGTVTLTQSIEDMRRQQLDPDTPYFFRIMVNKTIGTASGGTVTIRMGSKSVDTTIAALGSGWQEIKIAIGTDCWPRNFNENNLTIEVEWSSSTSGYLLVDDAIFTEWDVVDGTFWLLRHNAASPTAWMLDDTLEFTDTGGAPATAKIQWWAWVAGLGYLPSTTGTPTFTEP